MSIQQLMLGTGAVADPVGLEDVFKIHNYLGTASSKTIANGIDLSTGNDGLVWIKSRTGSTGSNVSDHMLFSKELVDSGTNLYLATNRKAAWNYDNNGLTSFNNNGFSLGSGTRANNSGTEYASWTFKKQKYFFTTKEYTGNGSADHDISHDLGCRPGAILIKTKSTLEDWVFWHCGMSDQKSKYMILDDSGMKTSTTVFSNTAPTSSKFTVGANDLTNKNSTTYIAYIFGGTDSDAAGAVSVDFAYSGTQNLEIPSSSDFNYGTGDFTWECWAKFNRISDTSYIIDHGTSNNQGTLHVHGSRLRYLNPTTGTGSNLYYSPIMKEGKWYHIAASRSSGTTKTFLDGVQIQSESDTHNYPTQKLWVGARPGGDIGCNGSISNLRIIKGTALYTGNFTPPTGPLTNVTNTVLLCCNNESETGSTVTPGTIQKNGSPIPSSIGPFEDTSQHVFGKNKDQPIIKCGSMQGYNARAELGFQPQFVLYKDEGGSGYELWDNFRGGLSYRADGGQGLLSAHLDSIESTGGGIKADHRGFNRGQAGVKMLYIAIAAPNGKNQKEITDATKVFGIDEVGVNSGRPSWVSTGFTPDFATLKDFNGTTYDWFTSARQYPNKYWQLSDNVAVGSAESTAYNWNYTGGFGYYGSAASDSVGAYMWKNWEGFQCISYDGDGENRELKHDLGRVPQMIWIKNTKTAESWAVYHEQLGNNMAMKLNTNDQQFSNNNWWNSTTPTAEHIYLGGTNPANVNQSGQTYIAMLFASVPKISAVSGYNGTSSGMMQFTSLDFSPRFLMVKRGNGTGNWCVFDTTRGFGNGDDKESFFNDPVAQNTVDVGNPLSNGFELYNGDSDRNVQSANYIFYAHA